MRTTRRSQNASNTSTLAPTTSPSTSRTPHSTLNSKRLSCGVRFGSQDDVRVAERVGDADLSGGTRAVSLHAASPSPQVHSLQLQSPLPVGNSLSMMYRLGAIVFLLVAVVPLLHSTSFFGHASMPMQPVSGGVIPEHTVTDGIVLDRRQSDSPTAVCKRWAQMSAVSELKCGRHRACLKPSSSSPLSETNTDFHFQLDCQRNSVSLWSPNYFNTGSGQQGLEQQFLDFRPDREQVRESERQVSTCINFVKVGKFLLPDSPVLLSPQARRISVLVRFRTHMTHFLSTEANSLTPHPWISGFLALGVRHR